MNNPVSPNIKNPVSFFYQADDPLSSSSLQQLLNESRQVGSLRPHSSGLAMSCGIAEPLIFHNCRTPHHQQSTPKYKVEEFHLYTGLLNLKSFIFILYYHLT